MKGFEKDLYTLKDKFKDIKYAIKIYCALSNMRWREIWDEVDYLKVHVGWIHRQHKGNFIPRRKVYSCTWRYAGGLVAKIRDVGEDYLDFYCSGCEGDVDDEVRKDLNNLGWEELPWEF